MFYLQKYGILKFVAPDRNLLYAQVVILPIFVICDIVKNSIGFVKNTIYLT